MYTVFFHTFGCKVNQAETAALISEFHERGYKITDMPSKADVIFINTCTVTHRSDSKIRQIVRRYYQDNPDAKIIVAGCYSQVSWQEIAKLKGVDYILGVQDKFNFFDHYKKPAKIDYPRVIVNPQKEITKNEFKQGEFPNRTRALVKIQDGCNQYCSYCIVPFTRGRARSINEEVILSQIKNLISKGYKEIVLTGVHIGKYGKDRGEKDSLAKLLEKITTIPDLGRIRLSSIDAVDISDKLLSLVADSEKTCNHFHIPLQSGSDKILKAMNRTYTVKEYLDKINSIVSRIDEIGLGTDIIAGFPGESEQDFKNTCNLISETPFTYLHVFPFSPRKLTKAYSMSGKIKTAEKIKRAHALRKLGNEKKKLFMSKWIGKTLTVLFESHDKKGKIQGLSSEYIPVKINFNKALINNLTKVKIIEMKRDHLNGLVAEMIG